MNFESLLKQFLKFFAFYIVLAAIENLAGPTVTHYIEDPVDALQGK